MFSTIDSLSPVGGASGFRGKSWMCSTVDILDSLSSVGGTSSVASPICQEGQSERTFPIFAFSSWVFLFFLIFCNFFAVRGDTLPLLMPPFPVAMPLGGTSGLGFKSWMFSAINILVSLSSFVGSPGFRFESWIDVQYHRHSRLFKLSWWSLRSLLVLSQI